MRIIEKGVLTVFLIFTLFTSLASAEILFSQPETVYNRGDDFEIAIKVSSSLRDANDFLVANLICGSETIELFRSPISLKQGGEKVVEISTILGRFLVGSAQGKCLIKAEFDEDEAESIRFDLTSEVDVSLNIEGISFEPGSSVKAYGEAAKSKNPLNGFVEVTVSGIDYKFTGAIKEGKFDFNFTIPSDSKSGDYEIGAYAYEKDSFGEILNEGKASSVIKIKSVMKKLEIALAEQTIAPKNELIFNVIVYDQAKDKVEADIPIAIYNPEGNLLKKEIVKSGESNNLLIESNQSPGYWKIEAGINGLEESRTFLIEEYRELSYKLEDTTLSITNVGNIPYTGPVEVTIGETSEIKELKELPIGGTKQFKLVAPDGEYTIGIGDGSKSESLGPAFLTGRAILVEDISSLFGGNMLILIASIVILIIAIVALFLYRKISRDKFSKPQKQFSGFVMKQPVRDSAKTSAIMDNGEKQESSIVALKIKNPDVLQNQIASKTIDTALWKAKELGAKIYVNGDFRIIVFAPLLTKQKDNSLRAVRAAQTMERILSDHNKRYSQIIEFGIGVNVGDLIVESKEGHFKFMSIDNTVAAAKNIAQLAKEEALISEKLHRVTAGKIKSQKLADKDFWKIISAVDRSDQDAFLKNMKVKGP
ncbi:hypothetical protein J4462_01725 [Candidatus Pacearchaeota archaeon]|nr:hypothetical protein [Candidatus Pacearchaeota archaeon]